MTPIPMLQIRKLRQGVLHEFSQGPRSAMLAKLGYEPKHSDPRVCLITSTPCYFRTTNCFLLCTQDCSYTLPDTVILIIIIIVIMEKYK